MELKLVVLAGAKVGLEIPLKKEMFLIGRAAECALRAGSEAISRRHCAITRTDGGWIVRDLGSRNGTYVNEQKITEAVPLAAGDELSVGPLRFRVDAVESKMPGAVAAPPSARDATARKQPPVKSVAEVVQRTVAKSDDSTTEEDVSRWLLGLTDAPVDVNLRETRTIRLEDTTLSRTVPASDSATVEDVSALSEAEESEPAMPDDVTTRTDDAEHSSRWNIFKRGKASTPSKKKPGKLPPRPEAQSKDSREAAADILREMTRRR